ncbi:MAG: hypothetical protein SWK76_01160 [Actinomycetota bacterium]|nr:hypothetical protein [Actinomycetota bacterium]
MPLGSNKVKVGKEAPGFCLPEGLSVGDICLMDYMGDKLLVIFLEGSGEAEPRLFR